MELQKEKKVGKITTNEQVITTIQYDVYNINFGIY